MVAADKARAPGPKGSRTSRARRAALPTKRAPGAMMPVPGGMTTVRAADEVNMAVAGVAARIAAAVVAAEGCIRVPVAAAAGAARAASASGR
jgi:hypothetical protein